jgi:ribosomal protein S8
MSELQEYVLDVLELQGYVESFLNFSDCGSKVQSSGIFIFYGI